MKADYPLRFIKSVVNEFQNSKECVDDHIPHSLFKITKPFKSIKIPYCEEISQIHKFRKFQQFFEEISQIHEQCFRIVLTWRTRNITFLFLLKDKSDYKSCVIFKGDSPCGSRYIGEIKRYAEVR